MSKPAIARSQSMLRERRPASLALPQPRLGVGDRVDRAAEIAAGADRFDRVEDVGAGLGDGARLRPGLGDARRAEIGDSARRFPAVGAAVGADAEAEAVLQ